VSRVECELGFSNTMHVGSLGCWWFDRYAAQRSESQTCEPCVDGEIEVVDSEDCQR
jgi:hypothetical protein